MQRHMLRQDVQHETHYLKQGANAASFSDDLIIIYSKNSLKILNRKSEDINQRRDRKYNVQKKKE
jgi:hypothetical protein